MQKETTSRKAPVQQVLVVFQQTTRRREVVEAVRLLLPAGMAVDWVHLPPPLGDSSVPADDALDVIVMRAAEKLSDALRINRPIVALICDNSLERRLKRWLNHDRFASGKNADQRYLNPKLLAAGSRLSAEAVAARFHEQALSHIRQGQKE